MTSSGKIYHTNGHKCHEIPSNQRVILPNALNRITTLITLPDVGRTAHETSTAPELRSTGLPQFAGPPTRSAPCPDAENRSRRETSGACGGETRLQRPKRRIGRTSQSS